MTQADFEKVRKAHDQLEKDAGSFVTIYELSQTFEISEQKLKAGFLELYQQTIWNYANNLRMNQAARLLRDTDCKISMRLQQTSVIRVPQPLPICLKTGVG